MIRLLLCLLLVLPFSLTAGCSSPRAAAPDGAADGRSGWLIGDVRQSVDEDLTPEQFLAAAERAVERQQEGVPTMVRVRPERIGTGELAVEADMLAMERFRSPLMHAATGGFPVRAEVAAWREEFLEVRWRLYSLKHEMPPEYRMLKEEQAAWLLEEVLREHWDTKGEGSWSRKPRLRSVSTAGSP